MGALLLRIHEHMDANAIQVPVQAHGFRCYITVLAKDQEGLEVSSCFFRIETNLNSGDLTLVV